MVDQWGGACKAVVGAGDLLCVGVGPRLITVDFSNPAAPVSLGNCLLSRGVQSLTISGDYAYALTDHLEVIDIGNPLSPVVVGRCPSSGYGHRVVVRDSLAFVASSGGLQIFDVSDSANPRLIGAQPPGGYYQVYDLAVSGDYVFASVDVCGMRVFDVSDPTSPQVVSHCAVDAVLNYFISGDYLYATARRDAIVVVDIRDPLAPREVGRADWPNASGLVAIHGNTALSRTYIPGSNQWGLQQVDISTPTNPVPFSTVTPIGTWSMDAAIVGEHLVIADGVSGLSTWLVQPPFPLGLVGRLESFYWVRDIAALNADVVAATTMNGIALLDVSGDTVTPVSRYSGRSSRFVAVEGNHAFCSAEPYGFFVLDLSEPHAPRLVAEESMQGGQAYALEVENGRLYVPVQSRHLRIFDVSEPESPQEVGVALNVGYVRELVVRDRIAFALVGSTLKIIDCTDPSQPVQMSSYSLGDEGWGLTIVGHRALVPSGTSSGTILDISDPANPVPDGYLPCCNSWYVGTDGETAYVGTSDGIFRIDTTIPWYFRSFDQIAVPGTAYRFQLANHRMVVGLGDDGLAVLDVRPRGDANFDYQVELADLATLLSNFGMESGATPDDGDGDCDGKIDLLDLSIMLGNFGR